MNAALRIVLLVTFSVAYTGGVTIWLNYGPGLVLEVCIPSTSLISDLKLKVADQVGICAAEQHIVDFYPNQLQDQDGWVELLGHKRLDEYGITEYSKGVILVVNRLVTINNLIIPNQNQLTVEYVDNSIVRVAMDPTQQIIDLKAYLAILLDLGPPELLHIMDYYPNTLMAQDGGFGLDHKTLSDYGIPVGSKYICIGGTVQNDFQGTLTIIYGTNLENNIPFNDYDTVWDFKVQMWKLTGIHPAWQHIVDYVPNPAQNEDGGVWQNWKRLSDYGMRNGNAGVLFILEIKVNTGRVPVGAAHDPAYY